MSASLNVGDRVPDFSATTAAGTPLQLSELLKQKAVVLFFYPRDDTAVCTKEACSFRDSYARFVDAGVEVVGVSSDSDARHQAFAQQHGLPFHLVSDADGSLRKLFGVPRTLGILPGRVTYVIDRAGVIRHRFSAQLASDEHVRQALAAIGQLEPAE